MGKEIATSKRGYHLGQIIPEIQQKAKSINSSNKMEVTFAQWKIAKCKLKAPSYKIKQAESPKCGHCEEEETVGHYFLRCMHYTTKRLTLKYKLEKKNLKQFDLATLFSNPAAVTKVE